MCDRAFSFFRFGHRREREQISDIWMMCIFMENIDTIAAMNFDFRMKGKKAKRKFFFPSKNRLKHQHFIGCTCKFGYCPVTTNRYHRIQGEKKTEMEPLFRLITFDEKISKWFCFFLFKQWLLFGYIVVCFDRHWVQMKKKTRANYDEHGHNLP